MPPFQVIQQFAKINKHYPSGWNGDTLLHIVCREGNFTTSLCIGGSPPQLSNFLALSKCRRSHGCANGASDPMHAGYYEMVEFMLNPKNRSMFEATELIVDITNDKERTPLVCPSHIHSPRRCQNKESFFVCGSFAVDQAVGVDDERKMADPHS